MDPQGPADTAPAHPRWQRGHIPGHIPGRGPCQPPGSLHPARVAALDSNRKRGAARPCPTLGLRFPGAGLGGSHVSPQGSRRPAHRCPRPSPPLSAGQAELAGRLPQGPSPRLRRARSEVKRGSQGSRVRPGSRPGQLRSLGHARGCGGAAKRAQGTPTKKKDKL